MVPQFDGAYGLLCCHWGLGLYIPLYAHKWQQVNVPANH